MENQVVYTSKQQRAVESRHLLVIACSDGGLVDPREEFLKEFLGIEKPDCIFLPGGAATLLINSSWFFAVRPQIILLNQTHRLKKVFNFVHSGCGYYRNKYIGRSDDGIKEMQHHDLFESGTEVKKLLPDAEVHLFYESTPDLGGKVSYYNIK